MRWFVTGGAGFIGSCFVRLLSERGEDVTVFDALTYAGHRENLEGVPGVELIHGNLCDRQKVDSLIEAGSFDRIINFAAESHVDRSITGPAPFIETNIGGTFHLLEAALSYFQSLAEDKRKTFRFLQVSTDEVFGELGETGYFTEATPYQPRSPYSASKASADHLVRAWHHTFGLPVLITNCSNNYGPRQLPEKLIPLMITHAVEGKALPVYGEGKNIRDWIHVEDHCRGILLALEKGEPGSTYCFGGNSERRNLEVVEAICKILDEVRPRTEGQNYKEQISFVKDRLGHDWRYAIDGSKAERELGFQPRHSFESGLKSTIEWYLENEKWCQSVKKKGKLS